MNLSIVSVTAACSDDIAITVEISDGERSCKQRLIISTEIYAKMQLCKGDIDRDTYDYLSAEASAYAAFKRALFILGYGACSKKTLVSKLVQKGFSREYSTEAAERAEHGGYLDDTSAATRQAECMASKLWGEKRIRAGLMQKGYGKEAVDRAMFALEDGGLSFDENCLLLMRRKFDTLPQDRAEMQKIISSFVRYGYTVSQIKGALERF